MIILNMIVRNEEKVLARAIRAVRPMIDAWAIVDTGSTDRTQEIVFEELDGLPGQLLSTEWTNYGDARTTALRVAESVAGPDGLSYAFIVDADDVWSGSINLPDGVAHDAYSVWFERGGAKWGTSRLLRLGCGIRYEGVVHEMPVTADGQPARGVFLEGLSVTSPNDGATYADPNKYLKHAHAISQALAADPGNTRYAFYLAQSYRDHGDYERAAKLYMARAGMGLSNEPEQVYVSYLEAGRCFMRLGKLDDAKRVLLAAHQSYAGRREAMAELARVFAVKAATSPTVGTLFVEDIDMEDGLEGVA